MRLLKAVEILIPPDKSISHRAVMLASVSEGQTIIKNLLIAEDIKRTIEAFQAMGVIIEPPSPPRCGLTRTSEVREVDVIVHGVGMHGLKKPAKPLYLGNSGTTMRILPGILAGQDFEVVLTGDKSLSKRPMRRIAEPLRKMGVKIGPLTLPSPLIGERVRVRGEICPPLKIRGGKLKPISYKSNVASAQVKSCILFAGLYANGVTSVVEPVQSRDHTERMLRQFGVKVFSTCFARSKNIVRARPKAESRTISFKGPVNLKSPGIIEIPGDISSAAFFIVAGCILQDTKIVIKNVGLNPTRTGILDILRKMGADIEVKGEGLRVDTTEPIGDIIVQSSALKGVTILPEEAVRAIDEIPVLMVAACFAKGKTIIKGIEELRVKETDRIYSMVTNLKKLGANIEVKGKGLRVNKNKIHPPPSTLHLNSEYIIVNGGKELRGAKVSSFGDHRTAMSMLIAGLRIKGKVVVTGLECINKSFPGFERLLRRLPSADSSQ